MTSHIESLVLTELEAIPPGKYLAVRDLCALVYGIHTDQVERSHRVEILSAANHVLERNPRFEAMTDFSTGDVIFFDGTDAKSWFAAVFSGHKCSRDQLLQLFGSDLEPGGLCYERARLRRAKVDGDLDLVGKLETRAKERLASAMRPSPGGEAQSS